jgi:hypothetical protein
MVTGLSEGDLQLPALREPAEDLQRLLRQVDTAGEVSLAEIGWIMHLLVG